MPGLKTAPAVRHMSSLSPRLQVRIQQKQILTPGLVQMVSLLQLNRLELKDMIQAEVAQNPVLEEATEGGEELLRDELRPLLEAERVSDPADQSIMDVTPDQQALAAADAGESGERIDFEPGDFEVPDFEAGGPAEAIAAEAAPSGLAEAPEAVESPTDAFDQIDFDNYFNDYLDPGFKSPASETIEKPSFAQVISPQINQHKMFRRALFCLLKVHR